MGTHKPIARRRAEGRIRVAALLILAAVSFLATNRIDARARAAIVVENVANKGIDTLLYNAMSHDLGYDVRWITPDTVAIRNSAYFDTAFDVVVWCGNEVAAPSPNSVADTIANSHAGFVSLHGDTWDEINLGTNSNGTLARTSEAAGFVRAINREHWITRVLQDTVYMWAATAVAIYGMTFPDSCHQILPLMIDKDNAGDTAFSHLAVADSGDTILNTGDGRNIAKGRRAFLGLFSVISTPRDSCQFFTIFDRTVAWAAGDTNDLHLKHNACFSGKVEVEDAWAENSSGLDSLESFGGWGSLYTGFDFDPKESFMQIKNDALFRKAAVSQLPVESFKVRMRVLSILNDPADSMWQSTNGIKLIKEKWIAGNATGQTNTNYVSWVRRYIAETDTFRWNLGGAFGANTDVIDTVLDSMRQNRGNTAPGVYINWSVAGNFANRLVADTSQNHGWVWHNYWNNQTGQINDAEIIYHSSEANAVGDRPVITIHLSDSGAISARRRYPVIGNGLLGGLQ